MIRIFASRGGALVETGFAADGSLPSDTAWVDMLHPSPEEEKQVESALDIDIPVREELAEIEASSRLYVRNGATFMTATLITRADNDKPQSDAVTFILTGGRLATVRYCEPRAVDIFVRNSATSGAACPTAGEGILVGLLEAIVDRAADHLERVGTIVASTSRDVFEPAPGKGRGRNFQLLLSRIGAEGDFTSNVRESLVSIGRLVAFFSATLETTQGKAPFKAQRSHLKTLQRDVQSLTDHASFLAGKITFLLDATLGMVTIEQNDIIKVFSVAAGIFLPPTLIASIYGMNFRSMPELEWALGYPFAVALMLLSAVLPYLYFRRKGWL